MGPLGNIVQKELMEMVRDPRLLFGMLIVPILIFPIMGVAISSSEEATRNAMKTTGTAVYNEDEAVGNTSYSASLVAYLELSNLTIKNVTAPDAAHALKKAVDSGAMVLLVIPRNFTKNILELNSSTVGVYAIFRDFSMTEGAVYGQVSAALDNFNQLLVATRLHEAYPDQSVVNLTFPLVQKSESVIKGVPKGEDPNIVGRAVLGSSIMMPMTLMILLIMAGQLAATSVAMEKEQKTLEVLLSLPVRRINILIGKLSGVLVVSLFATVSYLVGRCGCRWPVGRGSAG